MAISDPHTKVNFDAATDDPKVARGELATNVDIYNAMIALLGNIVELDAGDGVKDDGVGNLDLDLGTDPGLEIIAAQLAAKVGAGNKLTASGVETDINGLTEDTSPDTANDFFASYDDSASALKKVKMSNTAIGGPNMQVFTSNGTWVQPGGITQLVVHIVGAGGGGAGAGATDQEGGGGGGGEYVKAVLTVSGNISVTVNAGGTAGAAADAGAGGNGGTSEFDDIVANGGSGGDNAVSAGPGGAGGTGGSNGTGNTILIRQPGYPGEAGATNVGGDGAVSGESSGSNSLIMNNGGGLGLPGSDGNQLGGGGGGADASDAGPEVGGAGLIGYVIVEW